MIDHDKKIKLISSLLGMFAGAKAEAEAVARRASVAKLDDSHLSDAQREAFRKYQDSLPVIPEQTVKLMPQACAFLLSTGQIVGGVASNPLTDKNLEGEDAVGIAHSTLKSVPCLKKDFNIIAVAMTTTEDQPCAMNILDLFEQSLSELPNLKAQSLILVDPVTNDTVNSAPFSDYRIVS